MISSSFAECAADVRICKSVRLAMSSKPTANAGTIQVGSGLLSIASFQASGD